LVDISNIKTSSNKWKHFCQKKNENIITNNTNHTVAKALSRPKKTSRELSKLKPKHKNYEKQSSSSRPYEEQYQYITPIIHYD
jgi:hypothetical protein